MLNVVEIVNGKAVTTSRKVAEVFEKQHKHVLETIRDLEIPENFREPNFRLSEYEVTNKLGKKVKYPEYLITRDGFTILAMGFTGKKAMQFKIAYIEAFNAMEEVLKKQQYCCECKHPAAPTIIHSTLSVIEKINHQILAGEEVAPEVLRYAWNIGKLVHRQIVRTVEENLPVEFVDFVESFPCGEFSRGDVYDAYCSTCANPMSARWFWPRARKVRNFREKRNCRSRLVIFE